jgi:hypothetical protein
MTSAGPFPPRAREAQVDEEWAFVGRKEAACDPLDRRRGDDWDHTAVDPESRLRPASVPGQREGDACERLIRRAHDRTAGRTGPLITSDEPAPYETAIRAAYGVERSRPRRPGPGRPPGPRKALPADPCYATARERREKGHVVEVVRTVVFGTWASLRARPDRSTVSATIDTSFVARHDGADRPQGSRTRRKTCGCSEESGLHQAASYFIGSGDNFRRPVRTLRTPGEDGRWRPRTPAMAAGLTDHPRSLWEWITYPARPR